MKYIITLIISLLYVVTAQSQNRRFKKADALFQTMAYSEAAEEYQNQISKVEKEVSIEVLKRIGDAYYFNTDVDVFSLHTTYISSQCAMHIQTKETYIIMVMSTIY